MTSDDFVRDLRCELANRRSRAELIIAEYESSSGDVTRGNAVVEYRCARRGCLLLHVWRTPDGLKYYQPGYKLSAALNERDSNAAGRARNTIDGDRRWRSRGGVLDDLQGWGADVGIPLQCDHLNSVAPSDEVLAQAEAATPGSPTRRTF